MDNVYGIYDCVEKKILVHYVTGAGNISKAIFDKPYAAQKKIDMFLKDNVRYQVCTLKVGELVI